VLVVELATDEALDVEDSVGGVDGALVLGGLTDEALSISEGNPRGSDAAALV